MDLFDYNKFYALSVVCSYGYRLARARKTCSSIRGPMLVLSDLKYV